MKRVISAMLMAALLLGGCSRSDNQNSAYSQNDKAKQAPLVKAIAKGDSDAIHTLLSAGVPLNATMGDDEVCALMMAVTKGDAALVQRLLDAGAPIDQRDRRGDPALNYATYYGNEELVRILVAAGARKDLVGHGDAHDIALRFGREKVTQIIAPDASLPPFLAAAKKGKAKAMQAALERGADALATDKSGRNALHLAARTGNLAAVQAALDAGIPVDSLNRIEFTPLIIAARGGHDDVVQLLIERGASVDHVAAKRGLKMRALFMAAINGHTSIVDRLLAAGADINARDSDGGTAFTWAIGEGQPDMALHLLEKGSALGEAVPHDRLIEYVEEQGYDALAAAIRDRLDG